MFLFLNKNLIISFNPTINILNTIMCAINQGGDGVVNVLKFLEMFGKVKVVFVDVDLSELIGGVGS
jgi:hypothetical protein